MSRAIAGLKWAVAREVGPFSAARARGAKAYGIRYEKQLAEALGPRALRGQWFQFEDSAGKGWCQADLLMKWGDVLVCLEAKYTWVQAGHDQLDKLYLPILRSIVAGKQPVVGVVVCKRLTPRMPGVEVARTLEGALERAIAGQRTALHWIGNLDALAQRSAPRAWTVRQAEGMRP